MTSLETKILSAIHANRWSVSRHAEERMMERNVEVWQLVADYDEGRTFRVEVDALPNPKLLRKQVLADGTQVIVVWAFEKSVRVAKLVTVYFDQ